MALKLLCAAEITIKLTQTIENKTCLFEVFCVFSIYILARKRLESPVFHIIYIETSMFKILGNFITIKFINCTSSLTNMIGRAELINFSIPLRPTTTILQGHFLSSSYFDYRIKHMFNVFKANRIFRNY